MGEVPSLGSGVGGVWGYANATSLRYLPAQDSSHLAKLLIHG